jgi:hypothetical protein
MSTQFGIPATNKRNSSTIISFQSAFQALHEVTLYHVADQTYVCRQMKCHERTVSSNFLLVCFNNHLVVQLTGWTRIQLFSLAKPRHTAKQIQRHSEYKFVTKCVKHKQNSAHKTVLPISCYTTTRGTINIVNTSVTFELRLKGIYEFVDFTSIFRIYTQYEFMSEDTAAQTPNMLHLPFNDLIY